jgi:hypothetical protein
MAAKPKSSRKDASATIGKISLVCSGGLRPSHESDEASATVTDRRYSHRSRGNAEIGIPKEEPNIRLQTSSFILQTFPAIRRALIAAELVDTSLRDSPFPQIEAKMQALSEAKDNMVSLLGMAC